MKGALSLIMAYFKNKYGTYTVQVDAGRDLITGKRKRISGSAKTVREAKRVERELELSISNGSALQSNITLHEFVEQIFWDSKKHLRYTTLRGYRQVLNAHVLPVLGNLPICDITPVSIQSMINNCSTYKQAKTSRETLRCVLGLAFDLQLIMTNPAMSKTFTYPRQIDKRHDTSGVWLTSFAEHKKVLDCARETASPNVQIMLILGLCFGLRKGEILGMDWTNIDFRNKEIHVIQTYTPGANGPQLDPPKTLESRRTIPGPDYAFAELSRLRKLDGVVRVGACLIGESGQRLYPSSAAKRLKRWREKNRMPDITLMSLRHSFATASILAGIEVSSVSKWLGHTNTSTTYNKYVRPLLSDLHEDVEVINKAYREAK